MKKENDHGEVERYKVRLLAQGYFEPPGFDFDVESTYALTVDRTISRLLLAKAVNNNLAIWQYDMKTAYLEDELDPLVLTRLAQGMMLVNSVLAFHPSIMDADAVVHLVQSLHELHQSVSTSHATLDRLLHGIPMVRCK